MDLNEIANSAVMEDVTLLEDLPDIIPNSELQLDGDIACYYNSWPDNSLATDIKNLKLHIEAKRLLAGCEIVNVHTTRGRKAGREDIAQVQQYQETRNVANPEKKKRVEQLRDFLGTYCSKTVIAMPQWDIEADDSMSIRQRECIDEGKVSKIMTVDKDLDMVPGTHIHYDTYEEHVHPDGYGKLWIKESGELKSKGGNGIKKTLKGQGTSFFWAQLLMGDKADHIPGLPKLPVELLNRYKPTKAIERANKILANPKATAIAKRKAKAELTKRKASPIGPVLAYDILKGCKTDKQAFAAVKEAYRAWYGSKHSFVSWRNEPLTLTSGDMLLEQARLLWMLRTPEDDVLRFFTEI